MYYRGYNCIRVSAVNETSKTMRASKLATEFRLGTSGKCVHTVLDGYFLCAIAETYVIHVKHLQDQ